MACLPARQGTARHGPPLSARPGPAREPPSSRRRPFAGPARGAASRHPREGAVSVGPDREGRVPARTGKAPARPEAGLGGWGPAPAHPSGNEWGGGGGGSWRRELLSSESSGTRTELGLSPSPGLGLNRPRARCLAHPRAPGYPGRTRRAARCAGLACRSPRIRRWCLESGRTDPACTYFHGQLCCRVVRPLGLDGEAEAGSPSRLTWDGAGSIPAIPLTQITCFVDHFNKLHGHVMTGATRRRERSQEAGGEEARANTSHHLPSRAMERDGGTAFAMVSP